MPSLMTLVVMFAKFYCTNHGHKELGLCRQAQAGRGGVVKTVPTRAGQELANLNVSNKKIRRVCPAHTLHAVTHPMSRELIQASFVTYN